ncbi:hypothetical protein [Kitasatospora camelliae]|uniref:Uncharacterized protein n=1 Tax=Kitasatospora camelliae TaxID=3156397 RepID=A0AAU8K7R4_9ACTN
MRHHRPRHRCRDRRRPLTVHHGDLDDPRALIAVSAKSNRSKADKDVTDWLPPATEYRCTYVADWGAIKTRWDLAVDDQELTALQNLAVMCPNDEFTIALAR